MNHITHEPLFHYDCGSKLGFLSANVAYALDRSDLAKDFRAELKKILG